MVIWILKVMAISLLLTLVFELVFAWIAGVRNKKDIVLVVIVNIITNPIVVLTYYLTYYYTQWNVDLVKIIMEILAVAAEAYLYKKYSKNIRHPFLFSVSINIFSYFMGVLYNYLF